MSTFTGLNTMVRGIYINQISLNTLGHNLVNADTEGYSKQAVTPVATPPEYTSGFAVGTGAVAASITRARDVYADVQFRNENARKGYYDTTAVNYDKLEAIFNDSTDSGIEHAMEEFYRAWLNLSINASDSGSRTTIVEKGKNMTNTLVSANDQLRNQIADKYSDIQTHVNDVNQILEDLAEMNRQITMREADGQTMANDLRDQRDLLVDRLSSYIDVVVHQNDNGAYQISSNGVALVSGVDRLHLEFSRGIPSSEYGVDYNVLDYTITVRESDVSFMPGNGSLRAEFDAIDECKSYMNKITNMAAYMLTALNDQHKMGYDMTGELGRNFYGITGEIYEYHYDETNDYAYLYVIDSGTGEYQRGKDGQELKLTGVKIVEKMQVNSDFSETGGYKYVAAATAYDGEQNYTSDTDLDEHLIEWGERTGDGTNAVYISELFNMSYDNILSGGRANVAAISKYASSQSTLTALGGISLNAYYKAEMSKLGVDAAAVDVIIEQQDLVMNQIQNWRDSTAGVDWNEELANMIKYQRGFGACSRCLSAMDECLERLVNSTGVVGR